MPVIERAIRRPVPGLGDIRRGPSAHALGHCLSPSGLALLWPRTQLYVPHPLSIARSRRDGTQAAAGLRLREPATGVRFLDLPRAAGLTRR